jgi:phage protein D
MSNYFGPSFRVEVNGSQLAADVSKNIQQVTVVSKPDMMDTFSMVLTNAYPLMRWTHTGDADLFREGSGVVIALGYVDDMREMIDGEITRLNPTFPEGGIPTIAIDGYTRLHWLNGDKKTKTFQQMTDQQIVQKIASDVGLEPQVEDTGGPYDYVMQANQTDLEFARVRAARIRYEVLVQGKKLIFRKAKEMEPKIYTLVWGHAQEALSGANTMPLKSFAPDLSTMQQVNTVQVRGYDIKTKQPIVGKAGSGDEPTKMAGQQTGAQITASSFHRPREFVRVNIPVASQAEADQHAKAIYNDRAMSLVGGSGVTIGIPDLKSGSVVELRGIGPRFSGLYYIKEATHSIGSSGYQTNFTVQRNAV